ncbi:MAG: glycosyltransferase [Bacteroidetes bacterium]|jgi:glycosyltransferase involved in cell wall biosynthesis|nr:glycosyltransferase [Bacteroidota bacterium]
MDLSIVVPAFEEAASLPELAAELHTVCQQQGWTYEVWVVDDGSRDDTWTTIAQLHAEDARVAGIRLRRNYGKSAALAAGFAHARGRYVATLDADLQDDPHEIPALIATLEEGYDLVSGWKRERQDPLSKTLPSRFFNRVTRVVSGLPLHDFNCGLKVYRQAVVKHVTLYGELHRYIPLLAKWEGFDRITEQEVQHRPRQHGQTKFGLERFIRGFLDLVSVIFLTRFAARPMHFFGGLGTLSFLAGFFISLYLTLDKVIYGNYIGDRPLLLLGLLMILFGAQMFTTGLLGEMIISRRMEEEGAYEVAEAHPAPVRKAA